MKPHDATSPDAARAPASTLLLFAYAAVTCAVLIVIVLLRTPAIGVHFEPSASRFEAVLSGGVRIPHIAPEAPVTLSNAAGRFTAPAAQLVPDFQPSGDLAAVRRWWDERTRLRALAQAGPLTMSVGGDGSARSVTLKPRARRLTDLPIDVWLLLAQGLAVGLLGAWILALRPREAAARVFALACAGVLVTGFSGAAFDGRDLGAGGAWPWTSGVINLSANCLSGAALVGLFLVQPRPLLPPGVVVVAALFAAAWGAASGAGVLPLSAFYIFVLVSLTACGAALLAQWLASAGRPEDRAVLGYVGAVTLAGLGLLTVGMAAPPLLGQPTPFSDGWAAPAVLLVFAGLAFGVRRRRVFVLERWTHRILTSVLATLALLAFDALLVWVLRLEGVDALAVTLIGLGFVYLPARTRLQRFVSGRSAPSEGELFHAAVAVAFTPSSADRREQWRSLLQRLFAPLALEAANAGEGVRIDGEGRQLWLPAAAGAPGLRLTGRAGGRRLFTEEDVSVARDLILLMAEVEATRDAYRCGVLAERERIAQDLHDDVNARLLTSLHRTDAGDIRSDVRKAMADIRAMLASLVGEDAPLDQVLAEMRYEAAERLAAAGLDLDWPLASESEVSLDAAEAKALGSAVREIVSNIIRHADARHVTARAHSSGGVFALTINDDGIGAKDLVPRPGGGLGNLQRRMRQVGGELLCASSDAGLTVQLSLPLR